MTTIAYDGTTLSADGRVTVGSTIVHEKENKIVKLKNLKYGSHELCYAAFAGSLSSFHEYLILLAMGEPEEHSDSSDVEILFITSKGKALVKEPGKVILIECQEKHIALGSGSDFARSAMKLGFSTKEAVKHATTMDIYSGGRVRTVKIKP